MIDQSRILRNRAPKRFAADGRPMDAATRSSLARMKKQWRNDWEREAALLDSEHQGAAYAELDDQLDLMRSRWLENLSPKTRKLYDAYMAADEEDRANGYHPGDDDQADGADEADGDKANATPLLSDNRAPSA